MSYLIQFFKSGSLHVFVIFPMLLFTSFCIMHSNMELRLGNQDMPDLLQITCFQFVKKNCVGLQNRFCTQFFPSLNEWKTNKSTGGWAKENIAGDLYCPRISVIAFAKIWIKVRAFKNSLNDLPLVLIL